MRPLHYISSLLAAMLLLCNCSASAQVITTIAGGNEDSLLVQTGVPATDCELNDPTSIIFDKKGNYYIADRNHSFIMIVALDGTINIFAGTGTAGFSGDNGSAIAAKMAGPYGLAIDYAGNIYFSDEGNSRIRKIDTSGIITTIAGTGVFGYNGDNMAATNAELNGPGGIAVDHLGNIYVADYFNNRVREINASGIITTIAGTSVAGYNGDGISATSAELNTPCGVALDQTDNLYVSDAGNSRIRKIDTSGIISTIAGSSTGGYSGDNGPATAAKLRTPIGVYADGFGNVYIGDTYNNVVRKVNATGIITTVAGDGTAGYSGDGGLATLAELNGPAGIITDSIGDLYIADEGNNRVRFVTSILAVKQTTNGNILKIYPNPSEGAFTLDIITGISEEAEIIITDISGHMVKQIMADSNNPVCIQLYEPPGVYLLFVKSSTGMLTEKIINK